MLPSSGVDPPSQGGATDKGPSPVAAGRTLARAQSLAARPGGGGPVVVQRALARAQSLAIRPGAPAGLTPHGLTRDEMTRMLPQGSGSPLVALVLPKSVPKIGFCSGKPIAGTRKNMMEAHRNRDMVTLAKKQRHKETILVREDDLVQFEFSVEGRKSGCDIGFVVSKLAGNDWYPIPWKGMLPVTRDGTAPRYAKTGYVTGMWSALQVWTREFGSRTAESLTNHRAPGLRNFVVLGQQP
jgi:hypothetical protein